VEDWEYDWCCLSESPKEIENNLIKIRITNRPKESEKESSTHPPQNHIDLLSDGEPAC
jgi:hypothetical protein